MAFPVINIDEPYGSNSVSTIDDYERETRRWLRDCIMQISGYPNCPTIKTEKWTTEGRPNRPLQGATGFNETLGSLERYNGSDWELLNDFIDISVQDNGYLKIKDTLIIQWGTVTPSSTGEITVQFPTQFSTKCYTVIPNKKSSDNGNINAYSFTKSSFKITAPSTSSINWIAIGE